jgi:hypothetical protein
VVRIETRGEVEPERISNHATGIVVVLLAIVVEVWPRTNRERDNPDPGRSYSGLQGNALDTIQKIAGTRRWTFIHGVSNNNYSGQ